MAPVSWAVGNGGHVGQDLETTVGGKALIRAAEFYGRPAQGDALRQFNSGRCLENGIGFSRDLAGANKFYALSAAQGIGAITKRSDWTRTDFGSLDALKMLLVLTRIYCAWNIIVFLVDVGLRIAKTTSVDALNKASASVEI
jgi:TPR repeat protein